MGNRSNRLPKAIVYPMRFFRTLGIIGVIRWGIAYITRRPTISLRVGNSAGPVVLRPRSTDIRVAYQMFAANDLGFEWPLEDAPRRIIDSGANAGYATFQLKTRWPDAEIASLEPDPGNFGILSRNCKSFPDIHLYQAGMWSATGPLRVDPASLSSGAWGLRFLPTDATHPDAVHAVSIPDLLDELGWDRCDLLKMDIEGAEAEIFEGNLDWMPRVSAILVESHGDRHMAAIMAAADRFGMQVRQEAEKYLLWHP